MRYLQGIIIGASLMICFFLMFAAKKEKRSLPKFSNDDIYYELKKVKSLVEDIEDAIDVTGYGNKNDREIGLLVKYIAREIK